MDWIRSILIAVAIAMVFRWAVGEPFRIPSESMVPTLQIGDRIWVNKWIYGLRFPFDGFRIPFTRTTLWYAHHRIWEGVQPRRWDVVVFKSTEADVEHDTLVKRIVALPGEHVGIHNGKIFIDGQPETLPSAMPPVHYTSPPPAFTDMRYGLLEDAEHAIVPPGHYLVLGDNSPYSRDGRVFGWLPKENILGRVACVWWPFKHATDFTGFTRSRVWQSVATVLVLALLFRIFVGKVERFPDPVATRGKWLWTFVSYSALGVRVPFSDRWFLRYRRPARDQWVAVEDQPLGGVPTLALGQVLATPGDEVSWGDEVKVNGRAIGLPGMTQNEGRYPSSTLLTRRQYLVMLHDERHGRRVQRVDHLAIRGIVRPLRRWNTLPATVGLR